MKSSAQQSHLRAIIANRVKNKQSFSSTQILAELREFANARGEQVRVKTLESALINMHSHGLINNYDIDLSSAYEIIFEPTRVSTRTMAQDTRGRVTVPKPILRSIGVDAYDTVYVTREPERVLLTSIPIGSDSVPFSVDCYSNIKLQLPQSNQWVAKKLNDHVAEVVATA